MDALKNDISPRFESPLGISDIENLVALDNSFLNVHDSSIAFSLSQLLQRWIIFNQRSPEIPP